VKAALETKAKVVKEDKQGESGTRDEGQSGKGGQQGITNSQ
jgi:hypothetical protein